MLLNSNGNFMILEGTIEKYLAEQCYCINGSIHKQSIFDKLVQRVVKTQPTTYQEIKISN